MSTLWSSPDDDEDGEDWEAFKDAPIDYHDYWWDLP